jgi:hypothetical protein
MFVNVFTKAHPPLFPNPSMINPVNPPPPILFLYDPQVVSLLRACVMLERTEQYLTYSLSTCRVIKLLAVFGSS